MFKGKRTCKILKEIRAQIAAENNIAYVTSECKYQGDCAGSCPKCEAEVRYLERELEKRARLGKAVTVAGLAVAITTTALGTTACDSLGPTAGEPSEFDPAFQITLDGETVSPGLTLDGEIEETMGESPLPAIALPEFEEYRHLLDDNDALYDFLLTYCRENGTLVGEPTYSVTGANNWRWTNTQHAEDGSYIECFNVHSERDPMTQVTEQTLIGLVFTPTEGADPEDVSHYLWTGVTVMVLSIETPAGDAAP